MTKTNYHKQSALFLIEAHGPKTAEKIAINYSKDAFLEGDLSKHFHWKFVSDQIGGMYASFRKTSSVSLSEKNLSV